MNQSRNIAIAAAALGAAIIGYWLFCKQPKFIKHMSIAAEAIGQVDRLIPVAIVGSGPAGLSAALYASRFNLHTVVFEGKKPGGQLMGTSDVENWPGMGRELGPKIIEKLRHQARSFGALTSSATIEKIDVSSWPYRLQLDDGSQVHALAIILAMGASPVKLNVSGEQEYWGKGVTSCAVCDAPFFRDKEVIVVGGGDAAAEECLQLASYAKKITLLVRGDKMRASHAMQQRLKAYPETKLTIRYQTQVKAIVGNKEHVTGVTLKTVQGEENMPIDGVFLAIGHTPNTQLVRDWLTCDKMGYISVLPQRQITSQPGIFAAGDVADHYYRQAGIASGDGIKAAIDAANFLRHHNLDDKALARYENSFFSPEVQSTKELPLVKSIKEFNDLLEQTTVPLVVDFFTPACPTCHQLMPHIAAVAESFGDQVKAVKVDGAALSELMTRYSVTSVPTVLIFKNGVKVAGSNALSSRRDVQQLVAQTVE